jgi:hypothetical protein
MRFKAAFSILIGILLFVFASSIFGFIIPTPEAMDYSLIKSEDKCIASDGDWIGASDYKYCNASDLAFENYNKSTENANNYRMVLYMLAGIALIFISLKHIKEEIIKYGLVFGSLLLVLFSVIYSVSSPMFLAFASGLALVVVVLLVKALSAKKDLEEVRIKTKPKKK